MLLALATSCLVLSLVHAADFAANSHFFEKFDDSWNSRWKYSDDAKYEGKFTRTPEGIQVRHMDAAELHNPPQFSSPHECQQCLRPSSINKY